MGPEEPESGRDEIRIERERFANPAAAHCGEAHLIQESGPGSRRHRAYSFTVKRGADPLDFKRRRIPRELKRRLETPPRAT